MIHIGQQITLDTEHGPIRGVVVATEQRDPSRHGGGTEQLFVLVSLAQGDDVWHPASKVRVA